MKILEITQELDEAIHMIYDSALKFGGMQVQGLVKQLMDSKKPSEDSSDTFYIEINEQIDRILHTICDSALRVSGMLVHRLVQKLIDSIIDVEK